MRSEVLGHRITVPTSGVKLIFAGGGALLEIAFVSMRFEFEFIRRCEIRLGGFRHRQTKCGACVCRTPNDFDN